MEYLDPFLDGTPLAIERLQLAWPSLAFSEKAILLTILLGLNKEYNQKIDNKVLNGFQETVLINIALQDKHAYIQYLAAKKVGEPSKFTQDPESEQFQQQKERFSRVCNDSNELIRYAKNELSDCSFSEDLQDPIRFWQFSHIKRLTLINNLKNSGRQLAEILKYVSKELIPAGVVSPDKALDVLLQYLNNKIIGRNLEKTGKYSQAFADGFATYDAGESIEALWSIIPEVHSVIAFKLIKELPEKAFSLSKINQKTLDSFSESQLEALLFRNDVELKKLRRKIYLESQNEKLRIAAVSSILFDLQNEDISRLIIAESDSVDAASHKAKEIDLLACYCNGGTLQQMHVICDYLETIPKIFKSSIEGDPYFSICMLRIAMTQRAKRLSKDKLKQEIFEVRLWNLALLLAPIDGDFKLAEFPEGLNKYKDKIIDGNPWKTYLNLICFIRNNNWEQIIDFLPEVNIPDFYYPIIESGQELKKLNTKHSMHGSFGIMQNAIKLICKKGIYRYLSL